MNIQQISRHLLNFEIWVVLALSAASLFWDSLLPVVVLTAAFFWILRLVGYGYLTVRTPVDWGIAFICFFLLVSVLITSVSGKTIPQVWRVLTGIALFYALVNWGVSRTRIRYLFKGTVVVGFLLAFIAPFSVQWAVDKLTFIPATFYQRFLLLVQDYIHPNVLAGSLILLLPFPLAYLMFGWKKVNWHERLLAITAVLLILTMLVLTRSRGAWIAAAVSIIILLLLRDRRSWLLLLLAGVGLLFLAYQFGVTNILETAVYSNSIGDWDGRLEIWTRAVNLTRDFPFTGIGLGSFKDLAERFYAYDIYAPEYIPHAHNLFMQITVDLGIPGIVAWLSILLTMIYISWQVYKTGRTTNDFLFTGIGAALVVSQIALGVHGVTDAVTWGMVRPAPLLWIIWGSGIASLLTQIQMRT